MRLPKICRLCLTRPVCTTMCEDYVKYMGIKMKLNNVVSRLSVIGIVISNIFLLLKIFMPYVLFLLIFFVLCACLSLILSNRYTKSIDSVFNKFIGDPIPKGTNWGKIKRNLIIAKIISERKLK